MQLTFDWLKGFMVGEVSSDNGKIVKIQMVLALQWDSYDYFLRAQVKLNIHGVWENTDQQSRKYI